MKQMKKTLTIMAVFAVTSMSVAAYACRPISWEGRYQRLMKGAAADFEKSKSGVLGPRICVTFANQAGRMTLASVPERRAAFSLAAKCARQTSAVVTDKESKEKFAAIAKKADDDAKKLAEAIPVIKKSAELKSIN
jgi:hypothetical protein